MCVWALLYISLFKHETEFSLYSYHSLTYISIFCQPHPFLHQYILQIYFSPHSHCYHVDCDHHHLLLKYSSYSGWSPCHNLLHSYNTTLSVLRNLVRVTTSGKANPRLRGRASKSPTRDPFPALSPPLSLLPVLETCCPFPSFGYDVLLIEGLSSSFLTY